LGPIFPHSGKFRAMEQ